NPREATFAALHRAGEAYRHRTDLPTRLPLPATVRAARSFQEIARLYPHLRGGPAQKEALALNPHLQAGQDQPLPDARLAAEALVAPGLSAEQRTSLIQRLVPPAVTNPTALDTVMARLLMAALPQDVAALEAAL